MKVKRKHYQRIMAGFLSLAMALPASATAIAAPAAGTELIGDYIVITNTNPDYENFQETGVLNGASSGESISAEAGDLDDHVHLNAIAAREVTMASEAKTYNIGDRLDGQYNGQSYVCIFVGANSYIWMETKLKEQYDAKGITQKAGEAAAKVYDGRPYEILHELSGGIPYLDNSGKMSIMLEQTEHAGFYAGESDITAIHIGTSGADSYSDNQFAAKEALMVHEGQHALFRILTCGGDAIMAKRFRWINEGLSVFAMDYLWGGDDPTGWIPRVENSTEIRNGSPLMYDSYRGDAAQDYSMPYLFVRYLSAQKSKAYKPMEFMKTIYQVDARTMDAEALVEAILKLNGIEGNFEETIKNFYVALVNQDPTGPYGFYGDAVVAQKLKAYPAYYDANGQSVSLPGTASILVKTENGRFRVPAGGGKDITYTVAQRYAGGVDSSKGSGTQDDPYLLSKAEDLNMLAHHPNAFFLLTQDIDMAGLVNMKLSAFNGTLDGGGYTITGLKRMLCYKNYGTIKNLNIIADFRGSFTDFVGVAAAENWGKIADVSVSGKIDGRFTRTDKFFKQVFGGVVGNNRKIITGCSSDMDIRLEMPANDSWVGGITGINQGQLDNSYSTASIDVTQNNSGSYALNVGGLMGEISTFLNRGQRISKVYSAADVKVNGNGAVNKAMGRLVGSVDNRAPSGVVESSFALDGMDAAGKVNDEVNNSILRTREQLQNKDTYSGWDFNAIWKMENGSYPGLKGNGDVGGVSVGKYKKEYWLGQELVVNNHTIIADGSAIPMMDHMITQFDTSSVGKKTVLGNYKGSEFQFEITVKEPVNVTALKVDNKPELNYNPGQKFNPEGTRLRATVDGEQYVYLNGGFTHDKHESLQVGDHSVTFVYGNQSVKLKLNIVPKAVKTIKVLTQPTRLRYSDGDQLDLSGLLMQLNYGDGTQSAALNASQMKENNLILVVLKNGGMTPISTDAAISRDMNGRYLYVYSGKVGAGNPFASVGKLEVGAALSMADQTVKLETGKENYVTTQSVSGGSGNYKFKRTSGTLPQGIIERPSVDMIWFEGTPIAAGNFELVYEVSDASGSKVNVNITLVVTSKRDQAEFLSFTLEKSSNPLLPEAVIGDIQGDQILLTVPYGTDVTDLAVSHQISEGAYLPQEQENLTRHSFTSPVVFTVTAENGMKKSYTVTVVQTEAPTLSSNANLRSLSGTWLNEGFHKDRLSYTSQVGEAVNKIDMIARPEDEKASVEILGANDLKAGENLVTVTVTAEDGTNKVYEIRVSKKLNAIILSSNANLRNISGVELNEGFHKNHLNYTAQVEADIDSIDLIGYPEDKKSVVEIQGSQELQAGENEVVITVTAEDETQKVYRITVTKKASQPEIPKPSSNADLKALSGALLNEDFHKDRLAYTSQVDEHVDSIELEAIPEDENASVEITGTEDLVYGVNLVTVTVTAEDGTEKVYVIAVTKEAEAPARSSNAYLRNISGLWLNEGFKKDRYSYTSQVGASIDRLDLIGYPEDKLTTVEIQGDQELEAGENEVVITVTAEDGTQKEYKIIVTKRS